MTAYVARRDLRLGRIVVAPAYVPTVAESLLGLEQGERITVHDLLYGLLLVSGNDAAEALAQAAAGTERAFVEEMNRAAHRLDLEHTSYANPIGLDQPGNYSSARDLVELAIRLRSDPVLRRILDTPETVLASGAHPRRIVNRNTLVRTVPYVNGVKTGYTLGAGYVLVASATRKGVTLYSAVLGAGSEAERDSATIELLDYGFALYHRRTAIERHERAGATRLRHQDATLALEASRPVRLTVREGERVSTRIEAPAEVDGPIERGQPLGRAVVSVDGEPAASIRLLAARSAPAATLVERLDSALAGPRIVVWALAVGLVFVALLAAIALRRRGRARGRVH